MKRRKITKYIIAAALSVTLALCACTAPTDTFTAAEYTEDPGTDRDNAPELTTGTQSVTGIDETEGVWLFKR